ncbi:hypothetical protein GF1_16500 [Desulfolithobacter dissulfuricans]|uniref:Curli production assembly/transport component CsgG n=1 Tax=Desulfolithobacter dissulfuricans TaxID=2795293 RepID=A0A915XI03_9BACT|nr:CsgG/HfaB family protein [Desulfolithobacter dissulfuricans]BCO09274.1 hypothetical protein GF1_16500 [Desulfolithobacter dissulfuricans]
MKKNIVAAVGMIGLLVTGCVSTQGPTAVKERTIGVAVDDKGTVEQLSCSDRSNIKISIGNISCDAAACRSKGASQQSGLFALLRLAGTPSFEGIGDGLQDMFTGSIQNTGCFRIFDRKAMEAVQKELALAGGPQQTASLEAADYLVMGSVTSINFENKSGSLGGGFIPVLGAISQTKQKATLGMDVRLIEVKTGEVIFSKTYTAESGKTSYGVGAGVVAGGVGFGGLSGLSGTAMEEVARDIVVRASYDIARRLVPPDKIVVRQTVVTD